MEFSKKPYKSFIDVVKKEKDWMPAVGHYKEIDSAYRKLSPKPLAIRIKRH